MDIQKELEKIRLRIASERELLTYLVQQEKLNNTKTFKPSRAVKRKIEKLERQYNNLAKATQPQLTKAQTFELELTRRQFALQKEEKALEDLIANFNAIQPTLGSTPLSDYLVRINSQRQRVRNKKRALLNWIGKENVPITIAVNSLKKATTTVSRISKIPLALQAAESILDVDTISAMLQRKAFINDEKRCANTEIDMSLLNSPVIEESSDPKVGISVQDLGLSSLELQTKEKKDASTQF